MKKRIVLFLILTVMSLTACGGGGTETVTIPATVPAEYAGQTIPPGTDAAAGAAIFRTNCESCHGPQGHGDGPVGAALDPAPKDLAELQSSVGDDYLFWRIATGKEGTSMVPWKGVFTDEQIWQVVAFIRTLK